MAPWVHDVLFISIAVALVLINGFFVAAEFALVKVRTARLQGLVDEKRAFSKTAMWLAMRLESSLSSCQLGITMASLALGWVGEPALAHLMEPLFLAIGIESKVVLHTTSFIIAFSIITSAHLVIGEQAPKLYAIRNPERVLLWCAAPMKLFFLVSYPLLMLLNWMSAVVLRWMGLTDAGHGDDMTEDEIRTLLANAHAKGDMSRHEHALLHAVFEFDDLICRRVMIPRADVAFFEVGHSLGESIDLAKRTKHTRFPLCEDSLDRCIGIIHTKDLLGISSESTLDLRTIMRPPHRVPETMPISKLLRHFQKTHQLMAIVIDEHGTVVGVVTLENVLERIVGSVEDEFDTAEQEIVPDGPDQWRIAGSASLVDINHALNLTLSSSDVDTLSGLIVATIGRLLRDGDQVELEGAIATVLECKGERAEVVRVQLVSDTNDDATE